MNKQKKQADEDNTNGSCGFGLVSGFSPLVDVTCTIHVQEGGLNEGNTIMGGAMGQVSGNNPSNMGPIPVTNSPTPNEAGIDVVMKDVPTSYANKPNPTPVSKANLQKLNANVPNNADFDNWLLLASFMSNWKKYGLEKVTLVKVVFFFKFSSNEGVNSVLRDGPWMILWVKFHDVPLVAYTSDGLSLIATKIGILMMLDSFTNSMCLESWGRSSYARILIEIDACNGFSNNLFMVVPNLEGPVDDCPKALKRVVNGVDKVKGGSSGADDDGFVEVKQNKSRGNNEGAKNFRPVLVKPKPLYIPKPTGEASPKTAPPANTKKASITCKSSKTIVQTNASTSRNGTFSLSNSFEVLNVDNSVAEDVDSGDRIVRSSVQEEGQSSTPLVEKSNLVEQWLLEGKCVLLDDEGKPMKRIDYTSDHESDDEVESVDNDMASFLASNPSGGRYGTNILLEQWRETYGDVDHEYDPYDDDLYEGQEISDKIQSICDNLDIKVRGRKNK
ncbi:hypothetical protein Tco_0092895 [Tanacetum coccineum]